MPDDVVERLQRLAARAGMSVSSLAVRELAAAAGRAEHPAHLGSLPDLDVETEAIGEALAVGRQQR